MHVQSEASGTQPASPVPGLSDLSVLARGGYSTVYRARQDSIGREVALKIDTRSLESERDQRRFRREAEAAGRMSGHPNVVNVYDAGVTEDNHPYLVMELCTGGSYATKLRLQGPLPPSEVRDVGVKIADALQAAHDTGILHRDVKPGNILINRYGVPGLADFGLAALPDPNRELSVTIEALTPAYAPPEVFRMETPTPLGDQYALAASLYALLAGRPPRWPATGTPSLATMVQILDDPVPDIPGIPQGLSNVLRQAMAAYPEDRYATAAEFRDALAALDLSAGAGSSPSTGPVSGGHPGPAAPAGWYQGPPPQRPPGPPGPQHSGNHFGAGAGPTSNFPPSTYVPPSLQTLGGYGPPIGPPGDGPSYYNSPARQGPPKRSSGMRRGLVVVGIIAAVLVVAVGIGTAIAAFVNSGDPGQSEGPRTGGPQKGPNASQLPGDPRATASASASNGLPDFPFPIPTSGDEALSTPCGAATFAASSANITARCPAKAECWRGRTAAASIRTWACASQHTWETYVIGTLSTSTRQTNDASVRADANVKNLCTPGVLSSLLAVAGQQSTSNWTVAVLGPISSKGTAAREFRCLAGQGTNALTSAVFVK